MRAKTGLIFLLLFCSVLPTTLGDWVESDYVYFEASPETISSSGWVTFTLLSKQYSGDCDLAWGFDSAEIQPSTPEIWANYSHTLWEWGSELDENGTAYPVKDYYESWFYDWKPLGISPTKLSFEHRGMNTWFLFKNVPITAGKVYKIRAWMNVAFPGLGKISGKYFFGMKRSIDTIQEAISTGKFFLLDPWYDSNWDYRLKLTLNNSESTENLTNCPVMVKLDSSNFYFSLAQPDGDDIRPCDPDNTTLAYGIEEYNYTTENAILWVKVPQIDAGSTTDFIYIYYGNEEASTGATPEAVWDSNFTMVQHMVDETNSTVLDSTQYDNDGGKNGVNEPIETENGQIDRAQDFDTGSAYISCASDTSIDNIFDDGGTISAWINPNSDGAGDSGRIYYKLDGANGWALYKELELDGFMILKFYQKFSTSEGYWQFTDRVIPINVYSHIAIVYDNGATTNDPIFYLNGINYTVGNGLTETLAPVGTRSSDDAASLYIGNQQSQTRGYDGIIDEGRLSSVIRTEDWINAQYLSQIDQFISYGPLESCYTLNLQILGSDPIEGATLTLTGEEGEYYDTSDSEGWVNLVVPWGSYEITISHAGYYVNPVTFLVDRDLYGPAGLLGLEDGTMIINEFNSALLGVQAIAIIFSVLYYTKLRGRWDFSAVCMTAWLVSALAVFGADTANWPMLLFYGLMCILFVIETAHEVLGMLDDRDNPWR